MNNSTYKCTYVCLLLAVGLLLTTAGLASAPPVQNMVGTWPGFYQEAFGPHVATRIEINGQTNRRFTGFVSPPDPVQPVPIEGTVSASGNVNFQGRSTETRLVGNSDLQDFGGGGAILNGRMTRFESDGRLIIPCVLVMRSFDGAPPETGTPTGRFVGTLASDENGPAGEIDMVLGNPPDPVRPTSFGGSLDISLAGQTHTFELLGTVNADGRFIAIAQTEAGHLILDAVLSNPPDPVAPATIHGSFTLELEEGSAYEGTFQTELTRSTAG